MIVFSSSSVYLIHIYTNIHITHYDYRLPIYIVQETATITTTSSIEQKINSLFGGTNTTRVKTMGDKLSFFFA